MSDADIASRGAESRPAGRAGWNTPALRILVGMASNLSRGRLRVVAPDGRARTFGTDDGTGLQATLVVRRPRIVYRVLKGGALGFAEAYLDGDVDTPDLEALLRLLLVNYEAIAERWRAGPWVRLASTLAHRLRWNTRRGSRKNIRAHYDLGNAFYALWLDPSMTYSAALFRDADDLERAQLEKYRNLAGMVGLTPGQHVLEVGCGWGGFAVAAAREFGCRVTALTISEEQLAWAQRRVAEAGLGDRVEVRFQDYRDVEGRFDAIVSIEMFEAVGEAYWSVYFDKLRALLAPGGRCGLQVITIDDRWFEGYRRNVDFIQRYVFPGGMLPSSRALREAAGAAGLVAGEHLRFGRDYARTLRGWAERFEASWPQICELGFDERFRRLWSYYLAYCEAGFTAGSIDVEQVVFARG